MKAVHQEVIAANRINPGETLRRTRESNGWSLAEVALKLNLTAISLSYLEAGAFDKLPGHTFARGYIRAYAKLLGINQTVLVQEFDQFTGTDSHGSNVHGLSCIEEPARVLHTILRIFSLLLLIVVIGGGFVWWQEQASQRGKDITNNAIEHVEVESVDGATRIHSLYEPKDQAVIQKQVKLESVAAPAIIAVVSAPALSATATIPIAQMHMRTALESALSATVLVATAAPAVLLPATPVLISDDGYIQITFIADCWTKVTDDNGQVLFSGLKHKGDTLYQGGKPPLTLRLGFARGAQVAYNGHSVNVMPFTSGETASLKLGQ
ncbi:RodZ domain-containing protein [Candidatus Pseudomonas adelgestsugas]|uniref:Cytoskeleton protein RodZ n=1 Tax=Candidatus Pseudomonas adelgestsugas TaxID=1302376 RepID=A0ABX5R9H2_9PSED|nr:RodZ family helix-turn-helix domain-containing protein [Candidatus Pseudomonas adelgestsugas]QAX82256.1 Cytoskeleton protein RodZ [Candidatus Pseudomonas adelgestsugas]